MGKDAILITRESTVALCKLGSVSQAHSVHAEVSSATTAIQRDSTREGRIYSVGKRREKRHDTTSFTEDLSVGV